MNISRRVIIATVVCGAAVAALTMHLATRSDPKVSSSASSEPTAIASAPAPADPVIVAAGDIACGSTSDGAICAQDQTADLIAMQNADAILTLGDNQYECGSLSDYEANFDPSWGRFKRLIRPAIGNHEYNVSQDPEGDCSGSASGAPGYWSYFGAVASPLEPECTSKCRGYYSWDLGGWHLIALNDQCSHVGGCQRASPEEVWLRADLEAHHDRCTLVYFHEPRWSSGNHGNVLNSSAFWEDFYEAGVDLVLNGHDHDYERFAPQDPEGDADPLRGIREFVVGTGGRNHTGVSSRTGRIPNSEAFDSKTFGVLKLTLHAEGYAWQFLPAIPGGFTDTGSGQCH